MLCPLGDFISVQGRCSNKLLVSAAVFDQCAAHENPKASKKWVTQFINQSTFNTSNHHKPRKQFYFKWGGGKLLNNDIIYSTNKVFLEHAVVELSMNSTRSILQVEKVSRPLKCHSNYCSGHTLNGHQPRSHNWCSHMRCRVIGPACSLLHINFVSLSHKKRRSKRQSSCERSGRPVSTWELIWSEVI